METRITRMKPYEMDRSLALGKRDEVLRKIIEYGLLGLIIFSPLPAASVYEWTILGIQLTALAMTAAYLLMKEKMEINPYLSRSLRWPKYLCLAFFLIIFIQIVPLPKFLVKILSPHAYSFQEIYFPHFLETKFMSLSLIPSQTFRAGMELLSYFLIGFLIVKTVTRSRQIKRIISLLIVMGVFEAFYGLFELYRKNPRILFYKKIYNLDSVTGTFVNRNHFSGYLEMIIPLAIGLIIARIDIFSLSGMRWRERIVHLAGRGISTNLLISVSLVVMSLAIIFSKSRSGVFLLVFAFILFFELIILYFGRVRYRQQWVKNFLRVVFLIITLISLYIGVGATLERFALDKLLQEGRPLYWTQMTTMIADFPLFGTGLGTFASVYPAYEKIGVDGFLVHAHNDYLEYFSELGIVGTIFLLGAIFYMTANSFLFWRRRRNPEVKGLALGGIVAIVVMMVHSFSDFNLHIPANMLLFSIVLSLTFVSAYYKKS